MRSTVVILGLLLGACASTQTTHHFARDVAEKSCLHLKSHESYGACYEVAYDWAATYHSHPRARRYASADEFLAAVNKVYGRELTITCKPIGNVLYSCVRS